MSYDTDRPLEQQVELQDTRNEYWPRIIDSITWGIVICMFAYWVFFV